MATLGCEGGVRLRAPGSVKVLLLGSQTATASHPSRLFSNPGTGKTGVTVSSCRGGNPALRCWRNCPSWMTRQAELDGMGSCICGYESGWAIRELVAEGEGSRLQPTSARHVAACTDGILAVASCFTLRQLSWHVGHVHHCQRLDASNASTPPEILAMPEVPQVPPDRPPGQFTLEPRHFSCRTR